MDLHAKKNVYFFILDLVVEARKFWWDFLFMDRGAARSIGHKINQIVAHEERDRPFGTAVLGNIGQLFAQTIVKRALGLFERKVEVLAPESSQLDCGNPSIGSDSHTTGKPVSEVIAHSRGDGDRINRSVCITTKLVSLFIGGQRFLTSLLGLPIIEAAIGDDVIEELLLDMRVLQFGGKLGVGTEHVALGLLFFGYITIDEEGRKADDAYTVEHGFILMKLGERAIIIAHQDGT